MNYKYYILIDQGFICYVCTDTYVGTLYHISYFSKQLYYGRKIRGSLGGSQITILSDIFHE